MAVCRHSSLNRTTTTRLDTNERPLRIGLEDTATPDAPFRGLVDDVAVDGDRE